MGRRMSLALALGAVLAWGTSAHAALLVGFNFDGYNGSDATFGSTANDAGVMPSTISRGGGLHALNWAATFGSYGAASSATDNSLTLAITHGDYVSFTVAPAGADPVTITDVQALGFWREGVNGGLAGLESSVTGFGDQAANLLGSQQIGGDSFSPLSMSYPLATPIVASSPVEFRLYFYAYDKLNVNHYEQIGIGKYNNNSPGNDGVIDLAVNGTAGAVPEPASLGVLVVGGAALASGRRRRR